MGYSNLLFQAFIYLVAAVITVPFAKRLGLGSVLGYLFAGIIIGPYVLKIVGHHTNEVMQFAQFGVVMMLFLVGLELRPAVLWQLRSPLFLTGSLQVILTTLVISLLAWSFGLKIATAAAIGMIFASSSTAIVLQMFNEKSWGKTEAGKTVFSVLLFQDIAVIPMLALFPLLAGRTIQIHDHHVHGLKQAILLIIIIIGLIGGGRFLVRPALRFIADSKLREAFTATALLLIIGIALAMDLVGLSPALGTFLAGVVLAESEYRHELESDIQPFKGLLLGLFFISVGASINFSLIEQNFGLIISLVLLLISIKFGVVLGLGKMLGKPWHESLLVAMALAQGGEFCFVLLSYSFHLKILVAKLTNELVAVVALSMLLTPLIIILYEKWIEPIFMQKHSTNEFDVVDADNSVVIAGFGRFGQIVGRFLLANAINPTILELDARQVDSLRKLGYKVFYGDAARMDLLNTAGLGQAKLFILAIDDPDKTLKIAQAVRKIYPHLKILIRMYGRTQVYDALHLGFEFKTLYREIFDSALAMAHTALHLLGTPTAQTLRAAKLFKELDEEHLQKAAPLYYNKDKDFINHMLKSRKEFEDVMAADREQLKNTVI